MKVLIIEDELMAGKRLIAMLANYSKDIEVVATIDNVIDSINFLSENNPDLIFMDIQLADGLCFEIFEIINVDTPVVFITAYDEYTLQAFKVNSIDYLLKPVQEVELHRSLKKFEKYRTQNLSVNQLIEKIQSVNKTHKIRFLIKSGKGFSSVETSDIAYFFSDQKLNSLVTFNQKKFIIDNSLDDLISKLDPTYFYKISRKIIVSNKSIKNIEPYFNNRLVLKIEPTPEFDVYVSRKYVRGFRKWLDL
ncbi:MAG: LytTR family DNA-binding domain-containing protein [Ignavibacteria bacterium]|nr:LytTR family DNA-binding domain-containing protein [Ignavibacteria bacterium]